MSIGIMICSGPSVRGRSFFIDYFALPLAYVGNVLYLCDTTKQQPPFIMEKQAKLIDRVRKLFALAGNNPNEHEAAQALRMARKLMTEHDINETDLEVAELEEYEGRTFSMKSVPDYVSRLANSIAKLFSVNVWWQQTRTGVARCGRRYTYKCKPVFVGGSVHVEVAGYTFEVLSRQLERARKNYTPDTDQWYSDRFRRKMAMQYRNAYAHGWVESVQDKIADMVPEVPAPVADPITGLVPVSAFDAYCQEKGLVSGSMRRTSASGQGAYNAGRSDGRNVSINKGMGGRAAKQLR